MVGPRVLQDMMNMIEKLLDFLIYLGKGDNLLYLKISCYI